MGSLERDEGDLAHHTIDALDHPGDDTPRGGDASAVIGDRADSGADETADQSVGRTAPPDDPWSDTPASLAVRATVEVGSTDPFGDAWADLPATSVFVPGRPGEARAIDALADDRAGLHLDQTDNGVQHARRLQRDVRACVEHRAPADFGADVAFDTVVEHALLHDQADLAGGTSADTIRSLLNDFGVPANVTETADIDGLTGDLRHGHGVIALVDSTTLWNVPDADPDGELVRDHAVYITGVIMDDRGHPVAFRLNDTGRGEQGRNTVVSAAHLRAAFELPGGIDRDTGGIVAPGGHAIVTDNQRDIARMSP